MDDIKFEVKEAIKKVAEEAGRRASYDPEGAARLAAGVANLTNSLNAIVVIEDQELHNAQIGAAPAGPGPRPH